MGGDALDRIEAELRTIGLRQEAQGAKLENLGLLFAELRASMMTRPEIEAALASRMSNERGDSLQRQIDTLRAMPNDARAQLGTYISLGALAVSALALLAQHWH